VTQPPLAGQPGQPGYPPPGGYPTPAPWGGPPGGYPSPSPPAGPAAGGRNATLVGVIVVGLALILVMSVTTVILVVKKSDTSTPGSGGASASASSASSATHTAQADICTRLDFSALKDVFGDPKGPSTPSSQDVSGSAATITCSQALELAAGAQGTRRQATIGLLAFYQRDAKLASTFYGYQLNSLTNTLAPKNGATAVSGVGDKASVFKVDGSSNQSASWQFTALDGNLVLDLIVTGYRSDGAWTEEQVEGAMTTFARKALSQL